MRLTSGFKTSTGIGSPHRIAALGAALAGTEVGPGIMAIFTAGYYTVGKGAARYVYDSIVDAAYVAKFPRVSFLAADGRGFRLDIQQRVTFHMLGARGDAKLLPNGTLAAGATDDHPALQNGLLFLASFNINELRLELGGSSDFMRSSVPIYGSGGTFYMSDTLEITDAISYIDGCGSGLGGAMNYCTMVFAPSKHGIRTQRTDTEGDIRTHTHGWGSDGTTIRNLMLRSLGGTGLFHGIRARARVHIENVQCFFFPGDGMNFEAESGHESFKQGNVNSSFIMGGAVRDNGRHGIYFQGADANACLVSGVDSSGNKQWGFCDESFLGNTFVGCHTDANGAGPYRVFSENSRTVIIGCYSEANQSASEISQHSVIIGGLHEAGSRKFIGPGTALYPSFGSMEAKAFTATANGSTRSAQLGSGGGDGYLAMILGANVFNWSAQGPFDIGFGIGGTTSPPLLMTGNGTGRQFGRGVGQPHVLGFEQFALGTLGNNNARIITMAENAPTTGEHARGEIVFNNFGNIANDAIEYWRCTQSGTPGTWVARS